MNLTDLTSLLSLLPLLSLCWVLPLSGALLEGIAARRGAAGAFFVPMSLLSLAAAVAVFLVFDAHGAGPAFRIGGPQHRKSSRESITTGR